MSTSQSLRRRLANINAKIKDEKIKKAVEAVKEKRAIFVVALKSILRVFSLAFFITTCALAFSYYPYHLQMRRLANVVKSDLVDAVLNVNATAQCPQATLELIRDPFDVFTVGSDVGFDPFNADKIPEYKITKKMIDDDERDTHDKWTMMQLNSRFLAINEWCLVFLLGLFILAFLSKVVVGFLFSLCDSVDSLKTCMGRCCGGDEDKFGKCESWYDVVTEVIYVCVGVLCLVVVILHEVHTYSIQGEQMKITAQYTSVCAPGTQHCFEDGRMELCDFMRGSVAPGESGGICDDENFVVPRCDIFGQDKVNAIDVISFGQYALVGNDCGDNYCPLQETRSTKVTMASDEYWETGGEGPHLGLYDSFSWDSTQGVIVSMHVFAGLFIATMLIEVLMVITGLMLLLVPKRLAKASMRCLKSCCLSENAEEVQTDIGTIGKHFRVHNDTQEEDDFTRAFEQRRREIEETLPLNKEKTDFLPSDKRFKINFV